MEGETLMEPPLTRTEREFIEEGDKDRLVCDVCGCYSCSLVNGICRVCREEIKE
jgi:hypothetical protein